MDGPFMCFGVFMWFGVFMRPGVFACFGVLDALHIGPEITMLSCEDIDSYGKMEEQLNMHPRKQQEDTGDSSKTAER